MSFKKLLANKKYPYFKKRKKLKFFWISKFCYINIKRKMILQFDYLIFTYKQLQFLTCLQVLTRARHLADIKPPVTNYAYANIFLHSFVAFYISILVIRRLALFCTQPNLCLLTKSQKYRDLEK